MGAWVGLTWGLMWTVIWVAIVLIKRNERMKLYELVEKAAEEGRSLPPEMLERLRPPLARRASDLRIGIVLVAIAAGMAAVGLTHFYAEPSPYHHPFYGPFGLFPIPLFLGVAFLAMHWFKVKGSDL